MARMPTLSNGLLALSLVLALIPHPPADASAPCGSGSPIVLPDGRIGCTHGPDPAPDQTAPTSSLLELQATPQVSCIGDGTDGNRVQPLYVVAADRPNRASEVVPQIRGWIEEVDRIFDSSATPYGMAMAVRWVHDSKCVADVKTVVIPANADDSFSATINALAAQGYDEPGRHYLSWVDTDVYCGIAVNYPDDAAHQNNANNGSWPLWARVDRGCWGHSGVVEAHELTHMLGAVQASAPNATRNGHCTDEHDIMCYPDGPGVSTEIVCEDPALEYRLDCNYDDYFHPAPTPGSYLAEHWNVARSSFLLRAIVQEPGGGGGGGGHEPEPGDFEDVSSDHVFAGDIAWLADSGITRGCNPPANDRFCPGATVTRGQMAAFLARALSLPATSSDRFIDDDSSPFEADIERLAAAGITSGCDSARFCPDAPITRGQMAAFLARALSLPRVGTDRFADDDTSPFESEIEKLAEAGITTGCATSRFCPDELITRGQMAAFLRRALQL